MGLGFTGTIYKYGNPEKDIRSLYDSKLIWNVIIENFNGKEMEIYNIFDHPGFMNELSKIKKDLKKRFGATYFKEEEAFKIFEKGVHDILRYLFWAKAEWEYIATSWPPFVENEEIERLNKEKEEHLQKTGYFYRTDVRLSVSQKIDVFTQVCLNWVPFISYVWEHIDLIKKVS